MRVLWTYELPRLGEESPDSSHAPLHWDGDSVLLPVSSFEHDRETRAKDASARGSRIDVHRVHRDGAGTLLSFRADRSLIAQSPVSTAPLVVGTRVFVLRWPSDHSAPALVALET